MLSRNPMSRLQNIVKERETFNEDVINFRGRENIEEMIGNICKGLEVINGIEFISCKVDYFNHLYEDKKTNDQMSPSEKEKIEKLTKLSKGVNKSTKTVYPLVSISQSRLMSVKIKMRYTDDKQTLEEDYEFYYPELIDNQYFYLSGNKFFPVFQLADAEYYRTGSGSIVLKTTFMPIAIRGIKNKMTDLDLRLDIDARLLELSLFKKKINIFLYYFSKFGVTETIKFFGMEDKITVLFEQESKIEKDLDIHYYFKLNNNITLLVDKEWFDNGIVVNSSLVYTFISAFKKRHIDEASYYETEYWKRQLGKNFTTNSSKTLEKSESIILSLERLLDNITRNNLRNDSSEKETVYHIIRTMMLQFENIIRIDNYDLANKRIRVSEYLLFPFIIKLSDSAYRMLGTTKPSVGKLRQIFSSMDQDYLIKNMNNIDLLRYSNAVNTIDLFTRILKGSKSGPQSQNKDNGSPNVGIRGIDNSYIGRIDLTSTRKETV